MSKPLFIGITGGSGSGKTTFVKKIIDHFQESEVSVLSQDNYYKPRESQIIDTQGFRNFDLPTSIDTVKMASDLQQLSRGEQVILDEYTFNNELAEKRKITIVPAKIVIVEGLFVLSEKCIFDQLDIKVYVHAKDNLKIIRRIKRDRVERNYPLEDVLYRYENHVYPIFEQYIKPYRDNADIVINNNENFNVGLKVLMGFIKNYLEEKK